MEYCKLSKTYIADSEIKKKKSEKIDANEFAGQNF